MEDQASAEYFQPVEMWNKISDSINETPGQACKEEREISKHQKQRRTRMPEAEPASPEVSSPRGLVSIRGSTSCLCLLFVFLLET